jgi:hypothetical protein
LQFTSWAELAEAKLSNERLRPAKRFRSMFNDFVSERGKLVQLGPVMPVAGRPAGAATALDGFG